MLADTTYARGHPHQVKARCEPIFDTISPPFATRPIVPLLQQISLVSANNKAWKALERERDKTMTVVTEIATCITGNREVQQSKDGTKQVSGAHQIVEGAWRQPMIACCWLHSRTAVYGRTMPTGSSCSCSYVCVRAASRVFSYTV